MSAKENTPYAKASYSSTAFGSVGVNYTVAITAAEGDIIEVKNGTDKDVKIKTKNLLNKDVEIVLPATDYSMRSIPLVHNGDISLKYNGSAPTTGNVVIQSICMGS